MEYGKTLQKKRQILVIQISQEDESKTNQEAQISIFFPLLLCVDGAGGV